MAASIKPSNPAQNMILVSLVLMAAGLGGIFEFILPQLKAANTHLAQATSQSATLDKDIADLQKVKSDISSAEQAMTSFGVSKDKLSQVVPVNEDVPGAYIQMQAIVADAGVTDGTYQLSSPVKDADGSAKIPVSVTASGSYGSLKAFLVKFEKNIRPVTFTSVSFTRTEVPGLDKNAAPTSVLSVSATGYLRAHSLSNAYAAKP